MASRPFDPEEERMLRTIASVALRHRAFIALAFCACLTGVNAAPSLAREDKSGVLTFEAAGAAGPLGGWNGTPRGPAETLFLDSTTVHEGRYSGRIERTAASPSDFSAFALEIPIDFPGDSLELRGWMKYKDVTDYMGLWQRQEAGTRMLAFNNMEQFTLKGSADWAEYRVTMPLSPKARTVTVGALLAGQGTLWVDDLRLYVDGKPVMETPVQAPRLTPLETDHEFDTGSRVQVSAPTPAQVENLVLLGKVWGFLKDHHPA